MVFEAILTLCLMQEPKIELVDTFKKVPYYRVLDAELTFYNEFDGDTPGIIMANGKEVHYGAVANDQLRLGTKILIDGEQFEVSDRFGANHPVERFDIYYPDDCEQMGRQKKKVYILEE